MTEDRSLMILGAGCLAVAAVVAIVLFNLI